MKVRVASVFALMVVACGSGTSDPVVGVWGGPDGGGPTGT